MSRQRCTNIIQRASDAEGVFQVLLDNYFTFSAAALHNLEGLNMAKFSHQTDAALTLGHSACAYDGTLTANRR
jgi:hypothetical protein